jgi:hypothetical protein
MLYTQLAEALGLEALPPVCDACHQRAVAIHIHGYASDDAVMDICQCCALQLARKLLEDLCDLLGDRHG